MLGQIGNWIIGVGLFGIGIAIVFIIGIIKQGQNKAEARGKILAEIKTETGWPYRQAVRPYPDGWVRVGKGDYMLPRIKKDGTGVQVALVGSLVGVNAQEAQTIRKGGNGSGDTAQRIPILKTIITEWDMYPSRPFLGMGWTQVPIRKQSWWENDPVPIVREEFRTEYTAEDAQAHTREMDAQNLGIRIQEAEARQKQFMELLTNPKPPMIVVILLIANILATIIGALVATGKIGG
jgi:hypothetical protein